MTLPELPVIGLLIERRNGVRVLLDSDLGVKRMFSETVTEWSPDGNTVRPIHPGDPAYFDYVCGSLSRTFLVAEPQE